MKYATRVGIGFDVHRLVRGRNLILGGLHIESNVGLEGHSDGDVLLHAVTDAILGACAMGDIGDHFSNADPRWKDANSNTFLQEAVARAEDAGFEIANLDSVIVAERPHLGAWKEAIRATLAGLLGVPVDRVNVKAKTNEGLGPVGEGRAIEAHAVVLLRRHVGDAPSPKAAAKRAKAPAKPAAKKAAKKKPRKPVR
jgi:2-C-methyl-D-erythritol 2,4-cyclodiphosphate synthase